MLSEAERLASGGDSTVEGTELLRLVAGGDEAAFARLYDLFSRPLFSLATGILRDVTAAEEVVQEVFVHIWERADLFDARCGKPLTWAVVLTRNKAIDRLRALQRRQRLAQALEEAGETSLHHDPHSASRQLAARESIDAMRQALTELAVEQRQAVELAFLGGLTQTEIAAQLGLPLGTVKARIRRGMLQLRALLEKGTLVDERTVEDRA